MQTNFIVAGLNAMTQACIGIDLYIEIQNAMKSVQPKVFASSNSVNWLQTQLNV